MTHPSTVPQGKQSTPEQHQRNLNVALSRAFVIHHQKDVEAQILADIEELAELPRSHTPAEADAAFLLKALSSFRPSDFDDLVAERVSQQRCGHALCPNQPVASKSRNHGINKHIQGGTDSSQQWCSNLCMEKSLWLKRQLNATPAWERQRTARILLHPGDRSVEERLNVDESPRTFPASGQAEAEELAQERGDDAVSWKPGHVMADGLVERPSVQIPHPPEEIDALKQAHTIDGFRPAQNSSRSMEKPGSAFEPTEMAVRADNGKHNQSDAIDEDQSWSDMFTHLKHHRALDGSPPT